MMKKQLILVLIFLTLSLSVAFSQEFVKGTRMLSFGIGVGDRYLGTDYHMLVPPLQANFDMGITEKLGIGYIGVGGLIGFSANRYSYAYPFYNYYYRYTYSNFTVASRGTYHFDLGIEKLDLYAGIILGINFSSVSEEYTGNGQPSTVYHYSPEKHGGIVEGLFGGVRYMFTPNFGVYSELGYTVSIISLGMTYKF